MLKSDNLVFFEEKPENYAAVFPGERWLGISHCFEPLFFLLDNHSDFEFCSFVILRNLRLNY